MIVTSRFRVMGTDVELLVDVARHDPEVHGALLAARRVFDDVEAKLSRFRPDSELSRLNREGTLAAPSGELDAALRLSLDARVATGGRFDPTVHDAVVAAGYDRTFDELPARVQGEPACRPAHGTPVFFDRRTGAISLAPGVRVDLGGIAKGLTAELVAEQLRHHGPCLVNAGGDIAVRGTPAQGDWPIGLSTADGHTLVIGLTSGGLATSGRDRRRWTTTSGSVAHHVIDPRTGAPAVTDVVRITVAAATAVDAETHATALMIAGADAAVAEAEALELAAVVVTADGRTLLTKELE